MRVRSGLILALALTAGPALAQNTTGSMIGTVKDETGAVLPGVSVALTGDVVVGTQTTTTNSQGIFHFSALPPGTYAVSFSLGGFVPEKRAGIHVPLGGTVEQNASLRVKQLSEEMTVTEEAPLVDAQANKVSTNYDKEWVRNAPVARYSFFDLINAAPGVNQAQTGSAVSTSLGSGTTDNSYQIDGTDFTAPSTGEAWPYPNTDAIQEIEVLSVGAPAEYGNLLGAVFNVVTRQGTNAFHGDFNFYYQHDKLTGKNTTPAEDQCADEQGNLRPCPFQRQQFDDLTAQVDGPVIKDKLWFFASYQYQRDYKSFAGSPPEFPNRTWTHRVFFKLNYQIDPKDKLQFAYHDDFYNLPCVVIPCSPSIAPSANTLEHGHNPSPNLTYTRVISDKTYVEARVSGFYGKDHGDPLQPGEPRSQPRYYDLQTGQITGGIYSWYDGDVTRTAASVKVSHFTDKFLGGSHDFKFGVQYNQGGAKYLLGINDYIYTYGGVPQSGYIQAPFYRGGKERSVGGFVDDTFRVNSRLTLNLGVRYDWSRASFDAEPILDASGKPTGQMSTAINNLFTWNVVSPRAGFTYKLTEDGKTLLKAHYGRYYRGIITGEFSGTDPAVSPRYSFSGTYDEAGNPIDVSPLGVSNVEIDPSFKAPYTDQYVVQLERELFADVGLSLNYVYKRGERYGAYEDVKGTYVPVTYMDTEGMGAKGRAITVYGLTSDPSESVFQLTNPKQIYSRFNGITIRLSKRMSHHWQGMGSLVLSRATGRLVSSLGGPAAEPTAALLPGQPFESTFGQNPNDYINTDGRLINDRPVTAKVQLVAELPWGFLVGANYTYQSGRPWSRIITLPPELVGVQTTILATPIDGSQRVKAWNLLDLRLQKSFVLHKDVRFHLFADVLNLFNDAAYDDVVTRLGTADGYGAPASFVLPRRLMLGAKLSF
jgi:outer membrane receptor protein involved in Fe transport